MIPKYEYQGKNLKQMQQQVHIEVKPEKESVQHDIMHFLQDNGIGLWLLLGFAGVGFLTIFRKKIKEWLK